MRPGEPGEINVALRDLFALRELTWEGGCLGWEDSTLHIEVIAHCRCHGTETYALSVTARAAGKRLVSLGSMALLCDGDVDSIAQTVFFLVARARR